ncbi:kinase-like domain-containing protein [Crucibulum laeve]|uniref:Kinase-like domain-containing protein n=1 Tax=Crucibulum laeve TaxID=68775 RepID=A0A5C3MHB9_9AGAR|nr:kinase-like domain-containing protein [Crucibulum laeve]
MNSTSDSSSVISEPPFDPQEPVRTTTHLELSNRRHKINQYKRGARIGKGKHGEVYLCEDESDAGREVALKVVKRSSPRDKIKLLRKNYRTENGKPPLNSTENSVRKEIAIMKKCRHAHLVRLLEVIDDPQQEKIYIAMEYLSGGPVEWANADHEPILSLDQTRRITRDVVNGLEYLHSHGIIHRDIKPANLIYTHNRTNVKIIDFGVAHFTPKRLKFYQRTHTQDILEDLALFPEADLLKRTGTPSFLAPEVVWFPPGTNEHEQPRTSLSQSSVKSDSSSATMGSSTAIPLKRPPITKAIDVWSLGVTFYCLLFGRTPFNVPLSTNENVHHNEFMLYNQICTQDWTVPNTMGSEGLATGGRHPKDPFSEGFVIIQLLDRMFQKNPRLRIHLEDVKRHPWFLQNIANPREWIRVTTPVEAQGISMCQWFRHLWK